MLTQQPWGGGWGTPLAHGGQDSTTDVLHDLRHVSSSLFPPTTCSDCKLAGAGTVLAQRVSALGSQRAAAAQTIAANRESRNAIVSRKAYPVP